MAPTHHMVISMSFSERFIRLRKQQDMTQQQMADAIGIHVTQVKRYEAGSAQPSLDIIKKIATTFNVPTDVLIFEEGDRQLRKDLQLKFEAVQQMSEEDQRTIRSLLDGMILKHRAQQTLGADGH